MAKNKEIVSITCIWNTFIKSLTK